MRARRLRIVVLILVCTGLSGCTTGGSKWPKVWPWSSASATPPGSTYSSTPPNLPATASNGATLPSSATSPAPLANNYSNSAGTSPYAAAGRSPYASTASVTTPGATPNAALTPPGTAPYAATPAGFNAPPATTNPYASASAGSTMTPQNGHYNPTYPGTSTAGVSTAAAPSSGGRLGAPPVGMTGGGGASNPYASTPPTAMASARGGNPATSFTPAPPPATTPYAPQNTSGAATASTAPYAPMNTSGAATAGTASRSTASQVLPAGGSAGLTPPPGSPYPTTNAAAPAGGFRPGSTGNYPGTTTGTTAPVTNRYATPIPATAPPGQTGPATVSPMTPYPSTPYPTR